MLSLSSKMLKMLFLKKVIVIWEIKIDMFFNKVVVKLNSVEKFVGGLSYPVPGSTYLIRKVCQETTFLTSYILKTVMFT